MLFISHSSSDVELVGALTKMLKLGLGISSTDVYVSSLAGHGTKAGLNYSEDIAKRVRGATRVLALVTESYMDSPWCMCEFGAAWALQSVLPVSFLRDGSRPSGGAFEGMHFLRLDTASGLDELADALINTGAGTGREKAIWNDAKDQFLSYLEGRSRSSTVPRRPTRKGVLVDLSHGQGDWRKDSLFDKQAWDRRFGTFLDESGIEVYHVENVSYFGGEDLGAWQGMIVGIPGSPGTRNAPLLKQPRAIASSAGSGKAAASFSLASNSAIDTTRPISTSWRVASASPLTRHRTTCRLDE